MQSLLNIQIGHFNKPTMPFSLFNIPASFDPKKDILPLDGKIILVTGANSGLGKQAVLEYAQHNPAQIWLAARSLDKAEAAADDIKTLVPNAPIKLLQLDLSSFDSIKKAAKIFSAESDRLDILMLNAGIMAAAPGLTREGYEYQFGINYMGHALLTKLLLPVLDRTAKSGTNSDVRIVSISSAGYAQAPAEGINFGMLKVTADSMGAFGRFGQSKLAIILFVRQLAKLYPQLTVTAIHPGTVDTNVISSATGAPVILKYVARYAHRFLASVDQGVKNQLWASVAKDIQSGGYYEPIGIAGKVKPRGKDDDLAKKLWDWTEKELEGHDAS